MQTVTHHLWEPWWLLAWVWQFCLFPLGCGVFLFVGVVGYRTVKPSRECLRSFSMCRLVWRGKDVDHSLELHPCQRNAQAKLRYPVLGHETFDGVVVPWGLVLSRRISLRFGSLVALCHTDRYSGSRETGSSSVACALRRRRRRRRPQEYEESLCESRRGPTRNCPAVCAVLQGFALSIWGRRSWLEQHGCSLCFERLR